LAIASARKLNDGTDGISYFMAAKKNDIITPLSAAYESEILRLAEAASLDEALKKLRDDTMCSPW
jgi:hypothetical protein